MFSAIDLVCKTRRDFRPSPRPHDSGPVHVHPAARLSRLRRRGGDGRHRRRGGDGRHRRRGGDGRQMRRGGDGRQMRRGGDEMQATALKYTTRPRPRSPTRLLNSHAFSLFLLRKHYLDMFQELTLQLKARVEASRCGLLGQRGILQAIHKGFSFQRHVCGSCGRRCCRFATVPRDLPACEHQENSGSH